MYGSFVCSVRPEKIDEPNQTRFTAGGYKINYPGEVATPTAEMLVAKILINTQPPANIELSTDCVRV
jgi:hypothetical protein